MDLYLYLRWASILVTGLVLFLTLKQSKQSVILIQEQSNKLEQENSNILFHLQLHEDSHHLSKLSILCDQDKYTQSLFDQVFIQLDCVSDREWIHL